MRAIQIVEFGGPEVLTLADVPEPEAPDGFEVLAVEAAGVNYADTHQAEDSYLSRQSLPLIPGSEVVGLRADGTRVAAFTTTGGYAEKAVAHPAAMFPLPDGMEPGTALGLLAQGLTAWHLLRTSTRLQEGESVVVHAAAGGVGTIAVQLAKRWGAGRVIAVASSEEKRELATRLGADATVDAGSDDLVTALRDANGGDRVDIVLEMAGGPTFDTSLAALATRGRLVTFGMASRTPATPVDPAGLMARSQSVIGFWLVHFMAQSRVPMTELLDLVVRGELEVLTGGRYALADARSAHEALRSRGTVGKLILDV